MSFDNFIPTLWSASILENLNDEHVYGDLFNHDYEGDIKQVGDSVRINSVGRITINSYTKASTTITVQDPDAAGQALVIDQSKYFAFRIDDIDALQGKPDTMNAHMLEAAWGFGDTIDADLATILWSNMAGNATSGTGNRLTDATSVGVGATDEDAYQILIDLGVKLTEANVPTGGRWAVVPPWFGGMLAKDPRAVSFGTSKNRADYANGRVGGQVAGFDLRQSNNVTTSGSAYRISAGYKGGQTFVKQIQDVIPFKPEGSFSDALKGLLLYGRKVTRPSALAGIQVTSA